MTTPTYRYDTCVVCGQPGNQLVDVRRFLPRVSEIIRREHMYHTCAAHGPDKCRVEFYADGTAIALDLENGYPIAK